MLRCSLNSPGLVWLPVHELLLLTPLPGQAQGSLPCHTPMGTREHRAARPGAGSPWRCCTLHVCLPRPTGERPLQLSSMQSLPEKYHQSLTLPTSIQGLPGPAREAGHSPGLFKQWTLPIPPQIPTSQLLNSQLPQRILSKNQMEFFKN